MRRVLSQFASNIWIQRRDLFAGLERFPVAVASLALFVVVINLEIAGAIELGTEALTRFGGATSSAAAIATATILFFESRRGRSGPAHAFSLALGAVAALAIWYWRQLGVAPASILAVTALCVPLAPYWRRREGFWSFVWQLATAVALAFIALAIFCAGVSAILASLDYLFGIEIEGSVYGHVWSTGLGFVGPLFALSQIPLTFPSEDRPDPRDLIVAGVRMLADFVAVPLLAIYALVLHAYALKIVVSGELPRGQIGWMVLSFGMAVLALRIIVDPFARFSRMPLRLFDRWWATLLFVPLLLLAVAIWPRISAYGFTAERYGLVLFAVFLAGVLAAQIPGRTRNDMRIIPALGGLLLLVTSFGPWGMMSLPARQQTERLMSMLDRVGALEGGRLTGIPGFDPAEAREAQSIVWALDSFGQLERLRPLFAERDEDPFGSAASEWGREVVRILGISNVANLPAPDGSFWAGPGAATAVPLNEYDLMLPYLTWTTDRVPQTAAAGGLGFEVTSAAESVSIACNGRRITIPASTFEDAVAVATGLNPPPAIPMVETTVDGARVGILFDQIGGRLSPDLSVTSGRYSLFLRAADWE